MSLMTEMPVMNPIDGIVGELERFGTPFERLAALDAVRQKRRKELYAKYWRPILRQAEAIHKYVAMNPKVFLALGGNRGGKTGLGSFMTASWFLGKKYFKGEPAWEWVKDLPIPETPRNIWMVGLDYNVLRDVIWREKLVNGSGKEPPMLPREGSIYIRSIKENEYQIFGTDGSILTGKSADSGREKFQSASLDFAWIDEECDEGIFDEIYQRTIDRAGKILITLTPLTDVSSGIRKPWIYRLVKQAQQGAKDIAIAYLPMMDNPYLPEAEKQEARKKWAGHFEGPARLYGKMIRRTGLVYHMWSREVHLVKPFLIPRDWRRIVVIDPADTGVTAALWAAIDPGDNVYLYKEYYQRDLVVSEHASNIRALNTDIIDLWMLDPFWGSQRQGENHKQGIQLYRESGIPARLAGVSREDTGINASLEYFNATLDPSSRHPKIYIFGENDQGIQMMPNFLEEMENYSWDYYQRGQNRGLSKDKPQKGNDHLMNCCQYLCASRPRGKVGADYFVPTPQWASLNSYT